MPNRSSPALLRDRSAEGRLAARPSTPAPLRAAAPGLHALHLARDRDALLYVPTSYRADHATPLAVMLHGAGGVAQHGISLVEALADAAGLVVLAPPSRRQTWDVILGAFGPRT